MPQTAVARDGNLAALFGNHQTKRVAYFSQSQGRAVARTHRCRLNQVLRQRQMRGKSRQAIFFNQHRAIVAGRMNIVVVEPAATRERSTCCGDTFYGELATEDVLERMRARASTMPVDDVIVYCVSCAKSMFNGGRRPRYMLDLVFGEETVRGTCDPDAWHSELDAFIEAHGGGEPGVG